MIKLFHIPNYKIDTAKFGHWLSGSIVTEFEHRFAEFVGCKYAISVNSATNAIYICNLYTYYDNNTFYIPSILPPVVVNALVWANCVVYFNDYTEWVGNSYTLRKCKDRNIIDSAQRVKPNQFINEARPEDIMIFSFFPTKPINSIDGGMICTNDKEKADFYRCIINNGLSQGENSWDKIPQQFGHKSYMNSIQAYIANENLKRYPQKLEKLDKIRQKYNKAFSLMNTSDHLYRVFVKDNDGCVIRAKQAGIQCGIHYRPLHKFPMYTQTDAFLPASELVGKTTVSIPFHEKLTNEEIKHIIKFIQKER